MLLSILMSGGLIRRSHLTLPAWLKPCQYKNHLLMFFVIALDRLNYSRASCMNGSLTIYERAMCALWLQRPHMGKRVT